MSLRIYATRAEWAADRRSGAPDFEVGASDAAGALRPQPTGLVERMAKTRRHLTPPDFARYLVSLA